MHYNKLFLLLASTGLWAEQHTLPHKLNMFDDVTIQAAHVTSEEFAQQLASSLSIWKSAGKHGVWLTLTKDTGELIPVALAHGFEFHHALGDTVVLTLWLPEDTPSMLPDYATRTAGAAGLVINEHGDVLTVVDKYGKEGKKLPGGGVKLGEDSIAAAIREVKEETGLDTEFESIVCAYERHKAFCGASDVYTVYKLAVMGGELKPQASEIVAVEWTPYAELQENAPIRLRNFLAAYQAGPGPLVPHRVPSFDGKTGNMMIYFAPQNAIIS